jgi:hypothetical protein
VFRGLRGLGNGAPDSLEEIEVAEQQYLALVEKLGTRPKFTEWHREGFQRMRARLKGEVSSRPSLPANEHMK